MQGTPVKDIVRALLALPPERLAEAYDFILFLQNRYGQVTDISDAWSDEDLADLALANLNYAVESIAPDDEPDDSTG